MDRLPAQTVRMVPSEEKKKRTTRLPLWARYGAAAAVVAAVFTLGTRFISQDTAQTTPLAATTSASYTSDDNIDAMADYIMVDNQDLYAYISGE